MKSYSIELIEFLLHDAIAGTRCLSVYLSHWCIVSRQLKISSNFFLGLVAPSLQFLTPSAHTQFQGEPLQ